MASQHNDILATDRFYSSRQTSQARRSQRFGTSLHVEGTNKIDVASASGRLSRYKLFTQREYGVQTSIPSIWSWVSTVTSGAERPLAT
jgi:hypothetical protein